MLPGLVQRSTGSQKVRSQIGGIKNRAINGIRTAAVCSRTVVEPSGSVFYMGRSCVCAVRCTDGEITIHVLPSVRRSIVTAGDGRPKKNYPLRFYDADIDSDISQQDWISHT